MTTFESSLQTDWLQTELDELTSSPGDSPARTSALQELEPACPVSAAACGPSFSELSLKHDRVGLSLRMSLGLELSALTQCSLTWQEQATPLGRWWWVLSTPEPRTDGSGFGLLPTPRANKWGMPDSNGNTQAWNMLLTPELPTDGSGCGLLPTAKASDGRGKGNGGNRKSPGLDQMARGGMLPTPTVGEAKGARNCTANRKQQNKHNDGMTLTDWAYMLPTPTARDWKSTQASETTHDRNSRPLSEVIGRMLPTPQARDWKEAQGRAYKGEAIDLSAAVSNGTGQGRLSPCFVEAMMGYPIGWTEVD